MLSSADTYSVNGFIISSVSTIQCGSTKIRIVVMNNLLPSSVKYHQKFDLKGSTYKRRASNSEVAKSSPTYKDLDYMNLHPDVSYW